MSLLAPMILFAQASVAKTAIGWVVVLIGVSPLSLSLWQAFLLLSVLFHHSNVRLPIEVERKLNAVFVTPRMHGIHHSDRLDEANSNWSSLLSAWDFLHRTMRFDVPQERVVIGVPAHETARDVTIGKILLLPFRRQRDDWASARNEAREERM